MFYITPLALHMMRASADAGVGGSLWLTHKRDSRATSDSMYRYYSVPQTVSLVNC